MILGYRSPCLDWDGFAVITEIWVVSWVCVIFVEFWDLGG